MIPTIRFGIIALTSQTIGKTTIHFTNIHATSHLGCRPKKGNPPIHSITTLIGGSLTF